MVLVQEDGLEVHDCDVLGSDGISVVGIESTIKHRVYVDSRGSRTHR